MPYHSTSIDFELDKEEIERITKLCKIFISEGMDEDLAIDKAIRTLDPAKINAKVS